MKYCSNCGTAVVVRVPEGEHLPRHVCPSCHVVHYQNPKIVVGCVPEDPSGKILLCRRAIADVEIGSLLAIVHILHAQQVHVFFRARMRSPQFGAGVESLEAHLVEERDIPWSDIAFPSTEYALRRYFEDRAQGVENHYFTEFDRRTAELGLSTPG